MLDQAKITTAAALQTFVDDYRERRRMVAHIFDEAARTLETLKGTDAETP